MRKRPSIIEVDVQPKSRRLILSRVKHSGVKRRPKKPRSLTPAVGAVLIVSLTIVAAGAFALAVRRVTYGPEVTPHLFLSLGLTKHDNISTLEFKHIAGESLRTRDLGLILEGTLENATSETQFVRYSVKNLPVGEANKRMVKATQYTHEWDRFVYVWADEARATAPHRFHVRIEGNGENVRFASMSRVSLLHEPTRGVVFSALRLPSVRLVLPPPPPPAYPAHTLDNIYIENTLVTTTDFPGHYLRLASKTGRICFGHGTSNDNFAAHSWIDEENNWCLATSSGNVGIGTASPSHKLHVENGNAYFGDNAYFGGNVGVGTTSPAEKLEVAGDLKLSGGEDATEGRKLYGGADARLNIYTNTNAIDSKSWIELWGDHSDRAGALTLAGRYIDFWSNSSGACSGTANMRLDNNGNLGIGTTNPRARLDVRGPTCANGFIERVSSERRGKAGDKQDYEVVLPKGYAAVGLSVWAHKYFDGPLILYGTYLGDILDDSDQHWTGTSGDSNHSYHERTVPENYVCTGIRIRANDGHLDYGLKLRYTGVRGIKTVVVGYGYSEPKGNLDDRWHSAWCMPGTFIGKLSIYATGYFDYFGEEGGITKCYELVLVD